MSESHKGTILVVDDEPLKRATLEIDLAAAGYRVIQAPDGATALQYLSEQPVDVVVADIRMPEIDGMQLLERVKAQSPQTHVVLMTAFGSVDSAVQAIKHGADDYMSKPFRTDVLVERLERLRANGQSGGNGSAAAASEAAPATESQAPAPAGGNGDDLLCCGSLRLTEAVAGVERSLIDAALRRAAGNQAKAAQFLGIPRTTLRDKMAKYGFVGEPVRQPEVH